MEDPQNMHVYVNGVSELLSSSSLRVGPGHFIVITLAFNDKS